MSKHTPGPWRVNELGNVADNYRIVIGVIAQPSNGTKEANARLIAAAPDLLNALKDMLDNCYDEERDQHTIDTVAKTRAAIAKATGETK